MSTSRSNVKEHWHVVWGHEVFVLFLSRAGDYGPRFDLRIRATKHILNWLSGEKNVGQLKKRKELFLSNVGKGVEGRGRACGGLGGDSDSV